MIGSLRTALVVAFAAGSLGACASVRNTLDPEANPGPCPGAVALHDASRRVDFAAPDEVFRNVAHTAEIVGVSTLCTYRGGDPIVADVTIDFGFGRGPAAQSGSQRYQYFVAVTRKDLAILDRQTFEVEVDFRGQDRVFKTVELDDIIIPRADENVSGTNFEIIVGLELTPEQIEFNRQGKRFRVDAGT